MASTNGADRVSDNDAAERPVREKLKKTSIATLPKYGVVPASSEDAEGSADENTASHFDDSMSVTIDEKEDDERGRSPRKRSFDDQETENGEEREMAVDKSSLNEQHGRHARKRSRDVAADDSSKENTRRAKSEPTSIEEANEDHEGSNELSQSEDVTLEKKDQEPSVQSPVLEKDGVLSPRKKRSRDQFNKDLDKAEVAPVEAEPEQRKSLDEVEAGEVPAGRGNRSSREEPEKKRHRDTSQGPAKDEKEPEEKIPSKSGFSNTSAVSPFGALARSKSPAGEASSATGSNSSSTQKQNTSSSAFAASGFAALAGSSSSPFGALGSSGGFGALGSPNKPSGFGGLQGESAPAASGTFGGSTTGTGFGSASGSTTGFSGPSGFGTLGGGFGSPFGGASGGLKSFASQGGPGIIGLNDKPARPFGTPANDEDDEDDDAEAAHDEGSAKPEEQHEKEEKRFRPQEVDTGEKGESTKFACRSKLYAFVGKEWKERGTGTFKLNIPEAGADGEGKKARLLMRTEQVYKVILNVPIKDMKVDVKGRSLTFFELDEHGKPVPLQLRVKNEDMAKEARDQILEEQKHL